MMRSKNEIIRDLQKVLEKLERLDVAIITRYPDSARAADEYSALRKGVLTLASLTTLYQQNLIALVNAIDEGANPQTVRGKLRDLLNTWGIQEVEPGQVTEIAHEDVSDIFQVVGDQANERSAWVRNREDGIEVLQIGFMIEIASRSYEKFREDVASSKQNASEHVAATRPEPDVGFSNTPQTKPGRSEGGPQTQ